MQNPSCRQGHRDRVDRNPAAAAKRGGFEATGGGQALGDPGTEGGELRTVSVSNKAVPIICRICWSRNCPLVVQDTGPVRDHHPGPHPGAVRGLAVLHHQPLLHTHRVRPVRRGHHRHGGHAGSRWHLLVQTPGILISTVYCLREQC